MQWDLFRTFETVVRLGSLTAASKALCVSQSTVSRHLSRLEEEAGGPLLIRETPVVLTQQGASLMEAIQPMADAALVAHSALENTPELRGEVTIATVGEMIRWVLVGRLEAFLQKYPHLRLRMLAANQVSSLAAGEADVAVRLFLPKRGDLVVKKLRTETYFFYAASSLRLHSEVPWIGLAGTLSSISDQLYAEETFRGRPARLLFEDFESFGLAVKAGLGVGILPSEFARRLGGLVKVCPQQIGAKDLGPIPDRDFWLVVHRSKQHVPKIRAVIEWLEESITN